MAGKRCSTDRMADAIMEGLQEYAGLAADEMKKAVRKAGNTARMDIQANAPEKTGVYRKSWAVKTVSENSDALQVVVYSKNRYQLAHLLEHGHALRQGGRTKAFPHIASAAEEAETVLEQEIERALRG